MSIKSAVISDTDILVHMISSGIFFEVMPLLLDLIYIPPKVEEELQRSHSLVYQQLKPYIEAGKLIKRAKDEWINLSSDQRADINKTRTRMRAVLDPGELDCYAYSVGMDIPAIISDDKGAKEVISHDSNHQKIVITFADLLILASKLDKLPLGIAEDNYNKVVVTCGLKLPTFEVQIKRFEQNTSNHPWIIAYMEEHTKEI